MAFTYNSAGLVSGLSSANPIQFNYTAGANSKLVVLTLCAIGGGITDVTGVDSPTYNGQDMSQVGTNQTSQEGATEIWYYLSPDASTPRQISIPNPSTYSVRYSCSDYTNAAYDASFFGGAGLDNGDAADVACSIASVPDGSVCVSCMVHGEKDEFASITGGTTLLGTPSIDEGATQTGAAYSIQSGTGTETHTYVSGGTTDDYNFVMGAWEEYTPPVIESLAGQSDISISATGVLGKLIGLNGQSDIAISTTASLSTVANLTGQSNIAISTSLASVPEQYEYTGYRYPHATLIHNGYLYVGCYDADTNGHLLKIKINDLSSYSNLSFPISGFDYSSPVQIRYSSSKDKIYVLFAVSGKVILREIDPVTLADSDVINTTDYSVLSGSFCLDETYVYIAARISNKILKYDMATWTLQDSNDIAPNAHAAEYYSGYVYLTHSSAPAVVTKIDITDMSLSSQAFATGYNTPTDDFTIIDGYLWCGVEAGSQIGDVVKVDISDLTLTYLTMHRGKSCWGVQSDGSNIWVVYNDGIIAVINPGTSEYVLYNTGMPLTNEILFNLPNFYVTEYNTNFDILKQQIQYLDIYKQMWGQSNISIAATGDLTISGTASLSGQSDIAISTTASLSTVANLTGQSNVAISTTSALSSTRNVSAQTDVSITTEANLSVFTSIVGQTDITVSTSGSISRTRNVSGQSDISLAATGSIETAKKLTGQSDISITTVSTLSRIQNISGQSDIIVVTSGSVGVTKKLTGQSDVTIATSGLISQTRNVSGQSDITISTTSDLTISGIASLSGQTNISVSSSGSLSFVLGSLSDYTENKISDHLTGKTSFTMPTVYIGVLTADPFEGGSNLEEPTIGVGNYARISTSGSDWNAASGGEADNASVLSFPVSSDAWSSNTTPLTHFALFDSASGGNMLAYASLTTARKVTASNVQLRFPIGALSILMN